MVYFFHPQPGILLGWVCPENLQASRDSIMAFLVLRFSNQFFNAYSLNTITSIFM